MDTIDEKLAAITTIAHGSHETREAGMCAMEVVSWLAGEPHSDAPQCACPVVARAMIRLNDRISDEGLRTELLKPLLPLLLNSRVSREGRVKRALIAADMAVRVFAPMALEARGKLDLARSLREARPIVDQETAQAGQKIAAAAAAASSSSSAYASAAYASAADAAYAASATFAASADDDADAAYADAAAASSAYAADAYAAAYAASAASAARRPVYAEGARMIRRMLEEVRE